MHTTNIVARKNRITILFSGLIFFFILIIVLYFLRFLDQVWHIINYDNRTGIVNDVIIHKETHWKRLVWPEELPIGDRIKNQLAYIPKGYDYENTPIKTVLIYTGLGDIWERPQLGQAEFFSCPVSQCMLTVNNSLGPEVDAVLFRHQYIPVFYTRPANQIWIIEHNEAPYATVPISDNIVFNWTANYRWDSDIPRPYGYFLKYEPKPPLPMIVKNYAIHKTKQVAWFVSNCNPMNNRQEYAVELSKHISVDIYGDCGTLKCPRSKENECFRMLEEDYKFYLAFENVNCLYYITEKLFLNGLSRDVLPIVMGASRRDYELVAPNNSFIHVDDFESPKDLAMYLHKLDKDDQLYNEYFKWKGTGTIVINTKFYCRLCAMLHDKGHPPKHYYNFKEWWNGFEVCHN